MTIQYAVIANPIYEVTADYSAAAANSGVSIPYRVMWTGIWENAIITESSYDFAK